MRPLALALSACLLLSTSRTATAAWSTGPERNVAVCVIAGTQNYPQCISDGAGGAIVTWQDARTGIYDIYAHHVLASGVVDPAWPANGRRVCGAATDQGSPFLVTDGAGGAIIVWYDLRNGPLDIFAQHVLATGVVDPTWPVDGLAVCDTTGDQMNPRIAPDGLGGAYITWADGRGASIDIYAHHVRVDGTRDPAYPAQGAPVCTAAGNQSWPMIIPDDAGGAVLTWYDHRNGTDDDVYAHHLVASGAVDPAWPLDGTGICTLPGNQYNPALAPDGAGGALIAWHDLRDATSLNVYAQHVTASGVTDPLWPVGGVALCSMLLEQTAPQLATDGWGGAYVAWQDWRIGSAPDVYVQHLLSTGLPDPAWPTEGQALIVAGGNQNIPRIVPGLDHDAFVVWQDSRFAGYDAVAQHLLPSGTDPAWVPGGVFVSGAASNQLEEQVAPDGNGGAIVVWQDYRNGSFDVYAERIDPAGPQWDPGARIVSVRDVPNDQGGKVKVSWNASFLENNSNTPLRDYVVLRSVPDAALLASGMSVVEDPEALGTTKSPVLLHTRTGAADYYWEYLGTVAPLKLAGYSLVTSTTSDSLPGSNPMTRFAILARATNWTFQSPPDSGYSVDNLAPPTPGAFAAVLQPGAVRLRWDPSTVADFQEFRLYRGASPDFVPDAAHLVGATEDTVFVDTTPRTGPPFYKLAALDVHGNASPYAAADPGATAAVAGDARADLAGWRIACNPVRGRTLELVGPAHAGASLEASILDVQGRVVLTRALDTTTPGRATLSLADARMMPGVYIVDVRRDDEHVRRRLVLLR